MKPKPEREGEGLASAEEGEVTFPAAHLAAHGGQYVIHISSGQLGAQVIAAQALQTALFPCWQTWNNKLQWVLKKHWQEKCFVLI